MALWTPADVLRRRWLAAAPAAEVVQGNTGVLVSVADLADRTPRALGDGEVLDLGGRRIRWIDTPHVPHGWDAGLIYEEVTSTLFVGDLFTAYGRAPASTDGDIVGPATETLVLMHGPAFAGDTTGALHALGDDHDRRLTNGNR